MEWKYKERFQENWNINCRIKIHFTGSKEQKMCPTVDELKNSSDYKVKCVWFSY